MDFNQLRCFTILADRLNFSLAAKQCHISLAAMSMMITNMEAELGFELFNRSKRAVALTVAGAHFYQCAQQMLIKYNNASMRGLDIANGVGGSVRLGICEFYCAAEYLSLLRNFKQEFPKIKLDVEIASSNEICSSVQQGILDAGIIPYSCLALEPGLDSLLISPSQFVVLVSSLHPLASCLQVTYDQLQKTTLAIMGEPGALPTYLSALHQPDQPLRAKYVDNFGGVLYSVLFNNAAAVLPRFLVENAIGQDQKKLSVRVLEFSGASSDPMPTGRVIYLHSHRDASVLQFINYLQQQFPGA